MGSLYVVDDLKFIPRYLAHINLSGSFIVSFSSDSPENIDIGLRQGQIKAALLNKLLMYGQFVRC